MKKAIIIIGLSVYSLAVFAKTPLTPTMGWSTWNVFGLKPTEERIIAQMDAMVNLGLADIGYRFVNIDDAWMDGRDETTGRVNVNTGYFPKGMKYMADEAHRRGLKAGIYTDVGVNTCGSYDTDFVDWPWGKGVGLFGYEEDLWMYLGEGLYQDECARNGGDDGVECWGFDFIKVDSDGTKLGVNAAKQHPLYWSIIKEIQRATGKQKTFNMCRWYYEAPYLLQTGSSWRSGVDIHPNTPFSAIAEQINKYKRIGIFTHAGHYADPDYLAVTSNHPTMTKEARQTQFAMWCMFSAPLVLGFDLTDINDETLALITNTELIEIDQDRLGRAAAYIKDVGKTTELWFKKMNTKTCGDGAVALYNPGTEAETVTLDFADICVSGKAVMRDVIAHVDLGETETYRVTVPPRGVVVLRISAKEGYTQENFHYYLPGEVEFDAEVPEIEGINAEAVRKYMSQKSYNACLIDVRTPEEYSAGHIEGAVNIPYNELVEKSYLLPVQDLSVTKLIVYGADDDDDRPLRAACALQRMYRFAPGKQQIFNLGGMANYDDPGVRIVWKEGEVKGRIEVQNADLSGMFIREVGQVSSGKAVSGSAFRIARADRQALALCFTGARTAPGPEPSLVTVRTGNHAFSFFLRDVASANPIYIPSYGVAVVPDTDLRSYSQVEADILSHGMVTKAARTSLKPEASFEQVAPHTRDMSVPIWLGLGRDMRMFEITEEMQDVKDGMEKVIMPTNSGRPFKIPEAGGNNLSYCFALGRGVGPLNNIRRWLENGTLPIYHSEMRDDDVVYHSVWFTSLENGSLAEEHVEGTDYLLSDARHIYTTYPPEHQRQIEKKQQETGAATQEAVLYCRTEIVNTGQAPCYAWLKIPYPAVDYEYDPVTGCSGFTSGRIFCVSLLDGLPVPAEEMAVLIRPGDTVRLDFRLTHQPVDAGRAAALREQSFDAHYTACRVHWQSKLSRAAKIHVPEKRIDEMMQAGLLHLDLNMIGREPDEALAANVGIYSPIGTESAPIIQYCLSMGLHDLARRSLDYFFATQQSNGKMGTFSYMVETGAILWNVGEYFRYTRDGEWIRKMKPGLVRACEYLMNWRRSDQSGQGMIIGNVEDPQDFYRQFMLNGYAFLGMSRMAEMMHALGEPEAQRFAAEAADWREVIRKTALDVMEKSPVVPLGDGTWSSTLPPWPEAPGPRLLYQKVENFRSHGTFTLIDALCGPVYLVFCEVFDPDEPVSHTVMNYTAELMYQGHSGFSQPYLGRLNWWRALNGHVKPFIDAYYTTISAQADRQTYSFWEHLYRISSHKTHEVGGFLMDTRWMLYKERGDTLKLFSVIPRAWLEEDKQIRLDGVKSYFGTLNVSVTGLKDGVIAATVKCQGERKPRIIQIRLPHPEDKKAVAVTGGRYIPEKESVLIENFNGQVQLRLEFDADHFDSAAATAPATVIITL